MSSRNSAKRLYRIRKVDARRRVLRVDRGDVIVDSLGDIVELVWVVPNLVEQCDVPRGHWGLVDLGNEVGHRIATFVAEVGRREALQREVRRLVVDEANCCIGASVVFDRNRTFRRTHSAHSRAIARWVILLRSRISNSDPYNVDSPPRVCGMKNSRRSLGSLSVALSVTKAGEVKTNSSSPICSSSLRSASNAKIENVDAAMRNLEPGRISALRSSPSSSLMLSMMCTSPHLLEVNSSR
jgi:hypothetical protein